MAKFTREDYNSIMRENPYIKELYLEYQHRFKNRGEVLDYAEKIGFIQSKVDIPLSSGEVEHSVVMHLPLDWWSEECPIAGELVLFTGYKHKGENWMYSKYQYLYESLIKRLAILVFYYAQYFKKGVL